MSKSIAYNTACTQLSPGVTRPEFFRVKPKECPKCFSEVIKVKEMWSEYRCKCLDCDHQWEELKPDPSDFRNGVRLSKDLDEGKGEII